MIIIRSRNLQLHGKDYARIESAVDYCEEVLAITNQRKSDRRGEGGGEGGMAKPKDGSSGKGWPSPGSCGHKGGAKDKSAIDLGTLRAVTWGR
ncbi:hypothetical protein niasHT_007847 [Heterodera trifolii]|uniref:Uncharacterized protein n=1 Tax=Heterodera trifolii TaxID=157864 RepID=A0ABD2LZ70_9BILA